MGEGFVRIKFDSKAEMILGRRQRTVIGWKHCGRQRGQHNAFLASYSGFTTTGKCHDSDVFLPGKPGFPGCQIAPRSGFDNTYKSPIHLIRGRNCRFLARRNSRSHADMSTGNGL